MKGLCVSNSINSRNYIISGKKEHSYFIRPDLQLRGLLLHCTPRCLGEVCTTRGTILIITGDAHVCIYMCMCVDVYISVCVVCVCVPCDQEPCQLCTIWGDPAI